MDLMVAFKKSEEARAKGAKLMVFDWDKAAQIIKDKKAVEAFAGLAGDWEWTGGNIFCKGKPYKKDCTYLASIWAIPQLEIDDKYYDCWKYKPEVPDWDYDTKWPESALKILGVEG